MRPHLAALVVSVVLSGCASANAGGGVGRRATDWELKGVPVRIE